MSETKLVLPYRKHNSFDGLRHRYAIRDVLPRIQNLQTHLARDRLSEYQRNVVRDACEGILGKQKRNENDFTLNGYVIEEINRLKDQELARYLIYRYRYEVYPEKRILDDFPPLLQIEPTSVCNYRCVFCYQTDSIFTRKSNGYMGMMSLDLFKKVIDQAVGKCEAVTLASRGEPLICPDIMKMLMYMTGKFLAFKINTNAWYLNEAVCHAILQAEPNTVVFSADAASEPSYSQLRVGGKLGIILGNIKRFRDIRARDYPKSRTITRVSGVKVENTPNLDEMEEFWIDLVDQVAFVKYNPWENTYERPINDITSPCSDLWRRMFIWWDGKVNPCDVDYKSTLSLGHVNDDELGNIWRSSRYEALRNAHLTQSRSSVSPCNRCTLV